MSFTEFAASRQPALYAEAKEYRSKLLREHRAAIASLPISGGTRRAMGGAANPALLYFLTRWLQPRVVLETGVSAGVSSRAILDAMAVNGFGKLFSSDLPTHLRPDQVGLMVPEHLRSNWRLHLDGDKANIPLILEETGGKIDLVHYDSDKSYEAKLRFINTLGPITDRAVVAFDDIDRDLAFREIARRLGKPSVVVGAVGILNLS
jgi:predicted O-methyltransferase YrrM